MSYIFNNPNPSKKLVGDCVIRAISLILHLDWERVYMELATQGFMMHDMPSSNQVWNAYLHNKGLTRYIIPDTCPDCYTVAQFANDHRNGSYLIATGTHVVAVINGDYLDTWDSGEEIPIYYWSKENNSTKGGNSDAQDMRKD